MMYLSYLPVSCQVERKNALLTIPLTLVIVAKEIAISITSVKALGTAVFTVVYMATHNILPGFICYLAMGVFAGRLKGRRHRCDFGCLASYPAQTIDLSAKESYETTR